MNRERWRQVKGLLALALEQPPEHRRAFLSEAAADDADLLGELTSLMDAHDRPSGFSLDEAPPPLMTSWEPLDGDRAGSYSKICSRCHSRYGPLVFVCPQDGEPLADDPEALIGATLDGLYVIEELVGHGAMGRVYRARHELLRDLVAIKVLRSDFARDEDFVRRFMREGRAARAIHHPNAVTVHDLRTTPDGLTYMVQEYIDGHTLRDEMGGVAMSLEGALRYLEPVAAALDEAHAHGVVHRDLKPENIMIGTAGGRPVVKLTDLGIAKLFEPPGEMVEAHTEITVPGQIMGTPHYMSPEQWGVPPGDGGPDIDPRADVYSFGVIAYELLAGRKPYEVSSVRQLCLSHLSRETPDLRDVAPELPEAVSAAVARALSKEREQRQSTCGELVAEMKAASAGTAPPPASPRSWALAAMAVALVAVVVAALAWPRPEPVVETVAAIAPAPARAFDCMAEIQKFRDGRAVKAPMALSTDRTLLVEAGDRVRFTLADPREGFVYVLNETVQGSAAGSGLRVLYPVSWANGGSPRVAAGQVVTLPPDASTWIEFDDERGTEAFWIVWSAEAIPALEGLDAFTNALDRGALDAARAQSIRQLLSSSPMASTETDPATGRTTVRGDGGPVLHRIEIQHY